MSIFRTVLRWFNPSSSSTEHLLLDAKFEQLQKVLSYKVRNRVRFENGLIHRSYVQFLDPEKYESNERLEFLGDAVLSLVVSEHLYKQFTEDEGDLTKYRSRLVNRKALAEYASHLHLEDFILVSPSAQQSLDRGNDSILADAYEAVIAAIYLDGGFSAAARFIQSFIITHPVSSGMMLTDDNFKSKLLEFSQSRNLGLPRYVVVNERGPDHERIFTMQVFLRGELRGEGKGKSKREAEQAAACKALETITSRKSEGRSQKAESGS